MYDETIDAKNKIISSRDLQEIFEKMGEILKKYKKISDDEERKNHSLEKYDWVFSYRDEGSQFKATVDFYDSTEVTFDSYEKFMNIFYNRLNEMKSIDIYYCLSYSVKTIEPERSHEFYHQSIWMNIRERKLDLSVKLKSDDPKLDDLYNFIKEKILTAPERYDDVISKRNSIVGMVSFSRGIIPAVVVSLLLLLVPYLNNIIFKGYVVFPVIALVFSYVIGSIISSGKLDKLYSPIVPEKTYAGHDENYKSIYKDDLNSFVGESEVLIGKKIKNLDNREEIRKMYNDAKKKLPIRLFILLIFSIAVIIIGFFI